MMSGVNGGGMFCIFGGEAQVAPYEFSQVLFQSNLLPLAPKDVDDAWFARFSGRYGHWTHSR